MKTLEVIDAASEQLKLLPGHVFDVLSVSKPVSPEAALNLSKVISKLSPLLGNMIEFNTCEFLNEKPEFQKLGKWKRQDPGFPDVIFDGIVKPVPGFEIKAWFPLATEITGRFKDSQNHFLDDRTHVALIAWLPEFLIYGRPKIIGVVASNANNRRRAGQATQLETKLELYKMDNGRASTPPRTAPHSAMANVINRSSKMASTIWSFISLS